MESDQLSTSRPFNSTPVREKQQTATRTWHRLHVYVKEEGKAGLHFNIANAAPSFREEKRQSRGAASQMQIHLEIWVLVLLDESDEHPWPLYHKMSEADKKADWLQTI